MPKKLHPAYQRLHGYTLPVVMLALKEVGPPTAISKVGEQKQQGPLLVSLASELSCVLVGLLHEHLAIDHTAKEKEIFIGIRGGDIFKKAQLNHENALREKLQLSDQIDRLEARIIRFGAAHRAASPTTKGVNTPCMERDYLLWLKEAPCGSETSRSWRTEHRQLVEEYKIASQNGKNTQARVARLRSKIISAPDFQNALDDHLRKRGVYEQPKDISVDFESNHPLMREGSVAILQSTDLRWWKAFKKMIDGLLKKMSDRGHIRLMLRDPLLHKTARLVEKYGYTSLNEGWAQVLQQPSVFPETLRLKLESASKESINLEKPLQKDFDLMHHVFPGSIRFPSYSGRKNPKKEGSLGLSDTALRQWHKEIRGEDREVRIWIKSNTGSYHPLDWLGRHYATEHEQLTQKCNAEDKVFLKQYPPERAINELYWCLSHESGEKFDPLSSATYPLAKWREWVREANAGNPDYWATKG